MRAPIALGLGLLAALGFAVWSGSDAQTAPEPPTGVFVPNFWDPQRPVEKPNLDGLTAIRFLTSDDYPPFHFSLPDGSLSGFEIDLARAVCGELHVSCTIEARPWATLVAALKEGKGDAVIASLSVGAETAKQVAFTAPYYRTPARFVARLPLTLTDARPETLAGKRIGVKAGTAHAAYAGLFFARSTLQPFPTVADARAALKAGSVDVLFADGIGSALWLDGDAAGCCAFVGGPYTETRFFGEGAGIAVRTADVQLRRALDYGLARVAAKGAYADLYLQYFPVGFY